MVKKTNLKFNLILGGLIGTGGGFLLGIRESLFVIFTHAPRPFPFLEMITFSLIPVVFYALIGGLGMTVVAFIITFLLYLGEYRLAKTRLVGLYIGLFSLLAISLIGSVQLKITPSNFFLFLEVILISFLSATSLSFFAVYLLENKKLKKFNLTALLLSFFFSLLVFLYVGLWLNMNFLPQVFKPKSLLANLFFLAAIVFLTKGFYFLFSQKKQVLISLAKISALFFIIVFLIFYLTNKTIQLRKPKIPQKERPNVILIVMEATRADHLSSYGYHRPTTPALDQIAKEGVLFENAIATAPWTLPSHASLFTGLFPTQHKVSGEHFYLEDNFLTLAEVLKSAGYKTFGYSNNKIINPSTNLHQGFDVFLSSSPTKSKQLTDFLLISAFFNELPHPFKEKDDGAAKTNKIVKKWIEESLDKPFFIFINYMEPHDPYWPPGSYFSLYLDKSITPQEARKVNQNAALYLTGKVKMDKDDFKVLKSLYDGEISYLDFRLGELFTFLKKKNILDNTVLIITADHGENFGEHRLMSHVFCLYDTLLRVPLIIRYPKIFKPTRVKTQVQLIDVFSTILEIVGIKPPKGIQGKSLVQINQPRFFTIAEHSTFPSFLEDLRKANNTFDVSPFARRLKALRTEKFKYIWSSDGKDELYDLENDPQEKNNLIQSFPQKAKTLKMLLENFLSSL